MYDEIKLFVLCTWALVHSHRATQGIIIVHYIKSKPALSLTLSGLERLLLRKLHTRVVRA